MMKKKFNKFKMKYLKTFNENNSNTDLYTVIKPYLIEGKYLYHYTKTENLDEIKDYGLIPRKYPNSHYSKGSVGIFLTSSSSLYKANLPQELMDLIGEYYEDEDAYDEKPLVRLTIDITSLDFNKFIWDDDYILNKYGWNKAKTDIDKIKESLDIWGSIAYLGTIPPELIIKEDFDYSN
jgi:hypothetical protein